jgi:hypothetical protein
VQARKHEPVDTEYQKCEGQVDHKNEPRKGALQDFKLQDSQHQQTHDRGTGDREHDKSLQ